MNFSKLCSYMDSLPMADIPFADLEIRKDHKVVFRKGIGNPDPERRKPLTGDEIYRIASCSKLATCLGALKLVEEGRLSLNASVSDYIPEFSELLVKDGKSIRRATEPLTIQSLFLMGAGWGYDTLQAINGFAGRKDNILLARELAKVPMLFEPGKGYVYGVCHDILGGVIEAITGQRLGEYLEQTLFKPLGMKDTGFHLTEDQKKRQAAVYNYDSKMNTSTLLSEKEVDDLLPGGWEELGGSGLYSTVSDYSLLMDMAANGGQTRDGVQLLQPETIEKCCQNRLDRKSLKMARDMALGYGYGWGLCGRVHMNRHISQSRSAEGEFGWNGATATYALADTRNRISIFVGMQTLGCFYMVDVVHHKLRDLAYEAMNI